jgi:hypothetical protein
MTRRRTPETEARLAVAGFFRQVAAGWRPTPDDLAAEGIPPERHRDLLALCAGIADLRAAGHHAEGRRIAAEAIPTLLDTLGPDWQPPTPAGPNLEDLTPTELAHFITSSQAPAGFADPNNPTGLVRDVRR